MAIASFSLFLSPPFSLSLLLFLSSVVASTIVDYPHATQCVSDTIIISTRVARLNDQSTRRILISYRLFPWCLGRARVWRNTGSTGAPFAPFAQARIVVSIFVPISRSCTVASDNLPFLSPPTRTLPRCSSRRGFFFLLQPKVNYKHLSHNINAAVIYYKPTKNFKSIFL